MYKYRNLPYTGKNGWHVGGSDKLGGSGVLEWCYNESDARELFAKMQKFRRFSNLNVASNND